MNTKFLRNIFVFLIIFVQFNLIDFSHSYNRNLTIRTRPSSIKLNFKNVFGLFTGIEHFKYRPNVNPGVLYYRRRRNQDKKLFNAFLKSGMNRYNAVHLIDKQATIPNFKGHLIRLLKKTNGNSTFVFYYAGYSLNTKKRKIFTCWESIRNKAVHADFLINAFRRYYKGRKIILFADGHGSDLFLYVARKLALTGKSVIALTSIDKSKIETKNWIFTSALVNVFSGSYLPDVNADGIITLQELLYEAYRVNMHYNQQRVGFYKSRIPAGFVVSKVRTRRPRFSGRLKFKPGDFITGGHRITGHSRNYYITSLESEFKTKKSFKLDYKAKFPKFKKFRPGLIIQVLYHHEYFPVKVLKVVGPFHLVKYGGWSDKWNEWVMHKRLLKVKYQAKVYAKYMGKYYAAKILKEDKTRYYITYFGYDSSWNHWIAKNRLVIFK